MGSIVRTPYAGQQGPQGATGAAGAGNTVTTAVADPGDGGTVLGAAGGYVLVTGSAAAETRLFQDPSSNGLRLVVARIDANAGDITLTFSYDVFTSASTRVLSGGVNGPFRNIEFFSRNLQWVVLL